MGGQEKTVDRCSNTSKVLTIWDLMRPYEIEARSSKQMHRRPDIDSSGNIWLVSEFSQSHISFRYLATS